MAEFLALPLPYSGPRLSDAEIAAALEAEIRRGQEKPMPKRRLPVRLRLDGYSERSRRGLGGTSARVFSGIERRSE